MASAAGMNPLAMSTSSFRASQSQSAPLSYSDNPLTQLPTVDFNFEDLRRRTADFTVKFDTFIEKGRKRVLEERNEFRSRLGEVHEEQRSTTTQITTLNSTLSSHVNLVHREEREKQEIQSQIHDLEAHQARQVAHRDRLRSAIAHTTRQIEAKLAAQREYSEKMDHQARLNGPELWFWETYLGCRIEGAGDENLVKVVYVFPPATKRIGVRDDGVKREEEEKGGEREAWFELKVPESGSSGYEVVYCRPQLGEESVARVVGKLNETRDIAVLLKGMRGLFAEELK